MRSHDDDAPYPLVAAAAPLSAAQHRLREENEREIEREKERVTLRDGKPAGTRWTRENRRKERQIEREVLRHVEKGWVEDEEDRGRRWYDRGRGTRAETIETPRERERERQEGKGKGRRHGPRRIAVYNA